MIFNNFQVNVYSFGMLFAIIKQMIMPYSNV
jgi:hypothetical protein